MHYSGRPEVRDSGRRPGGACKSAQSSAEEGKMEITIPIKVKIDAVASSRFDQETVEQRLSLLKIIEPEEWIKREIDYLEALKAEKGW
jgi:hypothetical protein